MSLDLIDKFFKDLSDSEQASLLFIWHGGEPLLAGMDFFKGVVERQERYLFGKKVRNNLQTNGTLLDESWIGFLKDNHFRLGISIDGPKKIHDRNRISASGRGTHESVVKAVRTCQEIGMRFGTIATVTSQSASSPDELFDFFQEVGIRSYGLNFVWDCRADGPSPHSVSNDQYAAFMTRMFDRWYSCNDPDLKIREIDNMVIGLLGHRPKNCDFNGSCSNFLTLSPDGTLSPCERFADSVYYGNILEASTLAIYQKSLESAKAIRPVDTRCTKCPFFGACGGGCRYQTRDGGYAFCEGRRKVFKHISDVLAPVLST